jgi:hypothetical protein
VTAGDVAARAGLQLSDASAALNALAADTGATLQVSDAGDLLYVYRPGVRAALASKSWRLRAAPALAQAQRTGAFVVRTAFGATLLISILVVRRALASWSRTRVLVTLQQAGGQRPQRCMLTLRTPLPHVPGVCRHHAAAVQQERRARRPPPLLL